MEIDHQTLVYGFGILGNITSFIVFLAPMPTFYRIYKKKSTEGFQSLPYVLALFSAMILIYYGLLKDETLIKLINFIGCLIETFYILVYIFYAPRQVRVFTLKLIILLNVLGFGAILSGTIFFAKGDMCQAIVGWICLVFSVCVFVAPLCVMRRVIRTKSVEFMPLPLTVFLTLSSVWWFFYGFLQSDKNIYIPNVLGFICGIVQITLYGIYKNAKIIALETDPKIQELTDHIIDVVKLTTLTYPDLTSIVPDLPKIENEVQEMVQKEDRELKEDDNKTEKVFTPVDDADN